MGGGTTEKTDPVDSLYDTLVSELPICPRTTDPPVEGTGERSLILASRTEVVGKDALPWGPV